MFSINLKEINLNPVLNESLLQTYNIIIDRNFHLVLDLWKNAKTLEYVFALIAFK